MARTSAAVIVAKLLVHAAALAPAAWLGWQFWQVWQAG
ncbi:sulfoxide reductase heme-binding subunit YedZ, partial [Xanthomonas sp. Kuri4-3]